MRIGFVGLGAMGFGMATNLVAAGHALRVIAHRNREALEKLVTDGARECETYVDLAHASELVMLCLPNSEVVEQVIGEMEGGLVHGHIVVDTGTSSLASTARLAERLSARGVGFAEAPLTGGIKQAAAGELGALVGADPQLFTRIEPLLKAFCGSVQHFGPVGAGGRAKLINNYMVLGIAALVFEAFHAADRTGTDWAKLFEVVKCGSADSGVFQRMIGGALEGDFKRYVFSVRAAHKDMRYITEMNEQLGLMTPLNQAVLDLFEHADDQGYGNLMISELLRDNVRRERGGV